MEIKRFLSLRQTIGLTTLVVGLVLMSIFPIIYSRRGYSEYNHLWTEALLSTSIAPLFLVWGALVIWSDTYRPLTPVRALPIPAIALATYVYLDQQEPNLAFADTLGGATPRDPSTIDSLLWVLTSGRGALVAALCFVIVGVVMARHGGYAATASLAVPLAVAMVYPVTTGRLEDVAWQLGRVVLFGWFSYAFGYLVAADLDEDAGPISRRFHDVVDRVRGEAPSSEQP